MEEKERYEWDAIEGVEWIRDTKIGYLLYRDDMKKIADLLNQQDKQIKEIEEKLKNMYLLEIIKNDNYRTKKYGLDKSVQELRKIKLKPKEKEIYYKGFDKCERQFATHIAELKQQLKQAQNKKTIEVLEEIRKTIRYAKEICGGKATDLDIITANAYNRCLDDMKKIIDNQIKELKGEKK